MGLKGLFDEPRPTGGAQGAIFNVGLAALQLVQHGAHCGFRVVGLGLSVVNSLRTCVKIVGIAIKGGRLGLRQLINALLFCGQGLGFFVHMVPEFGFADLERVPRHALMRLPAL